MLISTFTDIADAFHFIEVHSREEYLKAEIYKTADGRWRVGLVFTAQLELFDGFDFE